MKLVTIAMFSVFVGCLGAQTQSQRETKTTTTTSSAPVSLDGTLVDQGCYATHSRTKETNSDPSSTTTTVTTKDTNDCPVTTSTRTFGLMTPDGRVVRFDDASNTRVNQMMQSDRDFSTEISAHKPVKVRVVAMPNGDVMVIKEIKSDRQQ